jgi:hypothetical protein
MGGNVNQLGLGEISDYQFRCRLTERDGYHLQLINTSVENLCKYPSKPSLLSFSQLKVGYFADRINEVNAIIIQNNG